MLEEPPVFNVGQGMVEFNRNWVESPEPPKANIGHLGGLGLVRPSSKTERSLIMGSKGLFAGATLYSGWKLSSSLMNNSAKGFSKNIRGHKMMASIFLGSLILTYKAW